MGHSRVEEGCPYRALLHSPRVQVWRGRLLLHCGHWPQASVVPVRELQRGWHSSGGNHTEDSRQANQAVPVLRPRTAMKKFFETAAMLFILMGAAV